jgi:hypothetical protein
VSTVTTMHAELPDQERITPMDVVENMCTALGIGATGPGVTLSPGYVEVCAQKFGLIVRCVIDPELTREVCLYRRFASARAGRRAFNRVGIEMVRSISQEQPAALDNSRPSRR